MPFKHKFMQYVNDISSFMVILAREERKRGRIKSTDKFRKESNDPLNGFNYIHITQKFKKNLAVLMFSGSMDFKASRNM